MEPAFSAAILVCLGIVVVGGAFIAARLFGLSLRASASTAVAFVVGAFVGAVTVGLIGAAIVGFGADLELGTVYLCSIATGAAIGGAVAVYFARRFQIIRSP